MAAAANKDRESLWDRVFGWMLLPGVAVALVFVVVGSMGWFLTYSDKEPSTSPVSGIVLADKTVETRSGPQAPAGLDQQGDPAESLGSTSEDLEANQLAEPPSSEEAALAALDGELGTEEKLRPVADGVVAKLVSPEAPHALEVDGGDAMDVAAVDLAPIEAEMNKAKRRLRGKVAAKSMGGDEQRLWEARRSRQKKSYGKLAKQDARIAEAVAPPPRPANEAAEEHVSNAFGRGAVPTIPSKSAAYRGGAGKAAPPPPRDAASEKKSASWSEEAKRIREIKGVKDRADAWIQTFERYLRSGRRDLARRALKALEGEPGWADTAEAKRRAMEGKGKAGAPTVPVPAAAEENEAPAAPD